MLWETLREEWGIWPALAILLSITLLFSNQLATWLEKSAFIKVLDSLSKLGLLVAVIAFLREIPKWEERAEEEATRRQFEYWKAIDAANTARNALREANLFDANLCDADILGANFQNAEYISVEQIKAAKNWEHAIYDHDFCKELGLLS